MLLVLSGATPRDVEELLIEGSKVLCCGLCLGLCRLGLCLGLILELGGSCGLLFLCVWIEEGFLLARGRRELVSLLLDCEARF